MANGNGNIVPNSNGKDGRGGKRAGAGRPPILPDRYLREVNLARAELRRTSVKAVQVLAAALDDDDPKVRVMAAREILAKIIPSLQSIQAQIGPIERPAIVWTDAEEVTP